MCNVSYLPQWYLRTISGIYTLSLSMPPNTFLSPSLCSPHFSISLSPCPLLFLSLPFFQSVSQLETLLLPHSLSITANHSPSQLSSAAWECSQQIPFWWSTLTLIRPYWWIWEFRNVRTSRLSSWPTLAACVLCCDVPWSVSQTLREESTSQKKMEKSQEGN